MYQHTLTSQLSLKAGPKRDHCVVVFLKPLFAHGIPRELTIARQHRVVSLFETKKRSFSLLATGA